MSAENSAELELRNAFEKINSDSTFRIVGLCHPFQNHKNEQVQGAVRTTILVFQQWIGNKELETEGKPKRLRLSPEQKATLTNQERWIAVAGLQAIEYDDTTNHIPNRRLAFLQYLDTTGLFQPRHLQKQVTQALVEGYLNGLTDRNILSCHIYAKASPEYIFSLSEKNPSKFPPLGEPLPTSKLVDWWCRTLQNVKIKHGYLYLVGGGPASLRLQMLGPSWSSGYPYPPNDPAMTSLPLFPDDQKSVSLSNLQSTTVSVRQLLDYMDSIPSNNGAGIFVLQFPPPTVTPSSSLPFGIPFCKEQVPIAGIGTFESLSASLSSSFHLLNLIQQHAHFELLITTKAKVHSSTEVPKTFPSSVGKVNVLVPRKRKQMPSRKNKINVSCPYNTFS